jgi:hypothetical protein
MGDETVEKMLAKGPDSVRLAEADWYIGQGGLEFSKPARQAFELGVMLAGSTARQQWVKTNTYADAREQKMLGTAYASSGAVAKPNLKKLLPAAPADVDVTPSAIRQWLRENGHDAGERGRISADQRQIYLDAHSARATRETTRTAAAKKKTGTVTRLSERRAARRDQATEKMEEARIQHPRRPRHAVAAPPEVERSVRPGRQPRAAVVRRTKPLAGEAEF